MIAGSLIDRLSPAHRARVREQLAMVKKPKKEKPKSLSLGIEFDSRLELDFADWLDGELAARRISQWKYHALRFQLAPGLTYTPDFLAVPNRPGGSTNIYEVKGSWKMKNARDSRTRLKIAAWHYSWLNWYGVTRGDDGDWEFETILKAQDAIGREAT